MGLNMMWVLSKPLRTVNRAPLTLLLLSSLVVVALCSPEEMPLSSSKSTIRMKAPRNKLLVGEDDGHVGGECTMEVQVTQKVVGECVKLGRFARGCVAGTFLEPYHQECV